MGYRFKLIGYPIKHSLSPWIHEQFLKKSNLKGMYSIFEISPEKSFEESVKYLKREETDGFNVTVPYKQAIIPFLDEIDDTARNMGAVNTVVKKNNRWIGYNTDGMGYLRSLENKYPEFVQNKNIRILLIGAGGAARAIYFALNHSGFTAIDIANRTPGSAREISELASSSCKSNILSLGEAEKCIDQYDLIIQTTSVGMKPHVNEAILSLDRLTSDTIVSDIVYQPLQTKFLQQAQDRGAMLHYGHTMLLYQAQYAFEIWTDRQLSINDLDVKLKAVLEGR
ncbi:shikimate dehydrogenase [Oceanobacillus massiliensis]|uniref:shikimate dehydrogenase n=1 Tax=Oceanobacillus massiliensis TaxID=1465765 RepID=UPI0030189EB1